MAKSEVGPWAADKLDRLGKYLNAYTMIMRKQRWCKGYYYIHAFAGPGAHQLKSRQRPARHVKQMLFDTAAYGQSPPEQQEFLAGSPKVALDLECPFSCYVFIEKDAKRIAELERLKDAYRGTRRIVLRKRECNEYLLAKVASNPEIDWRRYRALVFLDPFGMQVPWATLEALAATKAIEVFLNFPVGMAIQRFLLRKPEKFTQTQRDKLDAYFGSSEWYNRLYQRRPTLFGDETEEKVEKSGETLVKWYRDRLRKTFGFASKAALIRNSHGGHLYYLLLASPKKVAVTIFNKIIGVVGEGV